MDWARIPAYVTGTVDQELLARNEYLATENRILKNQLKGRLDLSMPSPFTFVLGVTSMTIHELQTGDRSRANYTAQVRDGSGARLDGGQGQS
jgi:hypothetical protein